MFLCFNVAPHFFEVMCISFIFFLDILQIAYPVNLTSILLVLSSDYPHLLLILPRNFFSNLNYWIFQSQISSLLIFIIFVSLLMFSLWQSTVNIATFTSLCIVSLVFWSSCISGDERGKKKFRLLHHLGPSHRFFTFLNTKHFYNGFSEIFVKSDIQALSQAVCIACIFFPHIRVTFSCLFVCPVIFCEN